MQYNGMLEALPYRTALQPYATWFALLIISLLTITNGFYIFIHGNWDARDFVAAYITLPIFLVLYLGHKIWFRTSLYIKTSRIDVITGKKEMDELEALDSPPIPKNMLEKIWFWIA